VKFDNEDGKGRVVGEASSGGADPCSVLATKDELIAANYASGSVAFIPILSVITSGTSSGSIQFGAPVTIQLKYSELAGHNPARQESSHAHQAILHPTSGELLVPDLGADKVCRFKKTDTGKWQSKSESGSGIGMDIQYEAGGGPRHVAFYKDMMYTLLELKNKVIAHHWPSLLAEPTHVASVSTVDNLPPDTVTDAMFAAEILVSKSIRTDGVPHLYVSNREDSSDEGDTIAIFSLIDKENGKEPKEIPELVKQARTGLTHVRGMSFGGPNDEWLIAGGVNKGGVKVFKRVLNDKGGEDLEFVTENKDIEKPTAFVWL